MEENSYSDFSFGRWTFSTEAEERIKKLKLEENNADSCSEENKMSIFEKFIRQVLDKSSEVVLDNDEEYFTDSSISTNVDEVDWEELKTYTKKSCDEMVTSQLEQLGRPIKNYDMEKQENNDPAKVFGTEKKTLIERNVHKLRPTYADDNLLINFSQSQIVENEPEYEDEVVYSLKEALQNEELIVEEVVTILNSNEITEEQLLDVWTELESCIPRLRFCSALSGDKSRTHFLCHKVLFPWLNNYDSNLEDETVQRISEILSKFPDAAIKNIIVPLINNRESSIFMKDVLLLRDIMSNLGSYGWNLLIQELVENMKMVKWQLPLLKLVVENVSEEGMSVNVINRLLMLMSTSSNEYFKDGEFGLLIIAVVNKLAKTRNMSEVFIQQLKNIGENYKGSMHFKIMNSIKQLSKS